MPSLQVNRAKVAIASLVLFLLSLLLTAYSSKNPSITRLGSAIVTEILSPLQIVSRYFQSGVSGFWQNYFDLIGVRELNVELQQRVAALQSENARLIELDRENLRLRGLLDVTSAAHLDGVSARIIGYDPTHWSQTITIDRGTADGVLVGAAVMSSQGVVGQVISSGPASAKVLLISDHGSGVDAIIQESRARGIVEGTGGGALRWSFVSPDEEVQIGDRVVTSGLDGVFPKGLVIGLVSRIDDTEMSLFREIELAPAVSFAKLENVFVISREVLTEMSPKATNLKKKGQKR